VLGLCSAEFGVLAMPSWQPPVQSSGGAQLLASQAAMWSVYADSNPLPNSL
jgi:hypothetical protein